MKKIISRLAALMLCLLLLGAAFVPVQAAEATETATQPTEVEATEDDEIVMGPGKMLALTFVGIAFAGGTVIGGGMLYRTVKKRKLRRKK